MLTTEQLLQQVNAMISQDIQSIKQFLLTGQSFTFIRDEFQKRQLDDVVEVAALCVAMNFAGQFPADIAESVISYKRASEKQAYWLAKSISEMQPVEFGAFVKFIQTR